MGGCVSRAMSLGTAQRKQAAGLAASVPNGTQLRFVAADPPKPLAVYVVGTSAEAKDPDDATKKALKEMAESSMGGEERLPVNSIARRQRRDAGKFSPLLGGVGTDKFGGGIAQRGVDHAQASSNNVGRRGDTPCRRDGRRRSMT